MDALSEILRVVHLSGAVFVEAKLAGAWGMASPANAAVAPLLAPHPARVVMFHLITDGTCHVALDDAAPVRVRAGEVVVFPHGDAHSLMSAPGVPVVPMALEEVLAQPPQRLVQGTAGPATAMVCGFLAFEERAGRLLLDGLPRLLRVDVHGSSAGAWLDASLRYALAEAQSPRPGGAGVLARLGELLFVEVLRRYVNEPSTGRTGWLAALADRVVGLALEALHTRPAHPWTLDELARVAGTSRSVLAERFQQLVGTPPMQYLTQWRLMRAAHQLSRSDAPLARIAEDVGYQTDTAFSRAFRREYGAPPAAWRRRWGTQAAMR